MLRIHRGAQAADRPTAGGRAKSRTCSASVRSNHIVVDRLVASGEPAGKTTESHVARSSRGTSFRRGAARPAPLIRRGGTPDPIPQADRFQPSHLGRDQRCGTGKSLWRRLRCWEKPPTESCDPPRDTRRPGLRPGLLRDSSHVAGFRSPARLEYASAAGNGLYDAKRKRSRARAGFGRAYTRQRSTAPRRRRSIRRRVGQMMQV